MQVDSVRCVADGRRRGLAEAFAERFDGERLPVNWKYPENKRGDTKPPLD